MFKITDNPDSNRMVAQQFKRAVKIAELTLTPFDPATVPAPTFTPATVEQVSDAAIAAAIAGKDPATDKGVLALLNSRLLGQVVGGFYHRNEVTRTRAELEYYKDQAPAIVEELTTKFNQAVTTMREQIPLIGHVSLKDSIGELDHMSDRKATAVTTAYAANAHVTKLVEAAGIITSAIAAVSPGPRHTHLLYVKYSLAEYSTHKLDGHSALNNHARKHNVWDMINDGLTIELATTPQELQQRLHSLENDRNNSGRNHKAEAAAHSLAKSQAKSFNA